LSDSFTLKISTCVRERRKRVTEDLTDLVSQAVELSG
jgi:hypothetical protein